MVFTTDYSMSEMISNANPSNPIDGLLIVEITNLFLQSRYFLAATGSLNTAISSINDGFFALSWFICRYCYKNDDIRWMWAIPFSIRNYECKEGSVMVYIVTTIFIFLYISWSTEILQTIDRLICSMYSKPEERPILAKAYSYIIDRIANDKKTQIMYFGGFFLLLFVIPIWKRLRDLF